MNLLEMANFVCGKVRKTDAASVLKAKEFLNNRYKLIYNGSLWRDALWIWEFTFTPEVIGVPESWDGIKFLPGVVDRLVALRTTDQPMAGVADEHLFRAGLDEFAREGVPARFATGAPVVCLLPSTYDTTDIAIVARDAGDVGRAWRMTIIDTDGNRVQYEGALVNGSTGPIALNVRVVERCTVVTPEAYVSLDSRFGDETIARCEAGESAFPARVPVRLVPKPTEATAFKALVKKKAIELSDDNDVAELRGVEDVLLPLAHGDMLERERQYGKAQLKHGEGLGLLAEFKQRHVFQEDQQQQILPEVYEQSGSVYDASMGKNFW